MHLILASLSHREFDDLLVGFEIFDLVDLIASVKMVESIVCEAVLLLIFFKIFIIRRAIKTFFILKIRE